MTTNSQLSTNEPKKKERKTTKSKQTTRTEWRDKNSKNEERLRSPWGNFKHSNIWITGMPEGEEEEQEIENLFEKIMKENFPNMEKEIDF